MSAVRCSACAQEMTGQALFVERARVDHAKASVDKAIADARAQGVREAIAAAERVPIAIHASRDEAELVADAISRTRGFVIRAIKALLPPDPIPGERCRVDNGDDQCDLPNGHTGGCVGTYTSKPAPSAPDERCAHTRDELRCIYKPLHAGKCLFPGGRP